MEAILLASVSVSAWAAAYALTAGEGDFAPLAGRRMGRIAWRGARDAVSALGRTRAARALASSRDWGEVAQALCDAAAARGAGIDRPEACVLLAAGAFATGAVASALFSSWLCLPAALLALALGVPLSASRRREAAARRTREEMPAVFRTLAVAMGAGMTLVQAAEYAGAHVGGRAGEALARLSLRLRCGEATERALEALAGELSAPGVGLLATALVISHRTGSPLRGLFQRSAVLVERQGEFERLLAVKTAQVRLSVRVVCLLPAVMVGLLAVISPDFQAGLGTFAGAACVCAAAVLDALAVAIIRRLVAGVLP